MPNSRPICVDCKTKNATVGMFLIQLDDASERHTEKNYPSHCRNCAQSLYNSDSKSKLNPKYFGFLTHMEIVEYLNATKYESPSEHLHRHGIFVLKKSKSSRLAALLQHLELMSDARDLYKQLDRLKNDGGREFADYRRWKNIDGDITGHNVFTKKQINEMKDLEESFLKEVEDTCFPTEKYAKIAMYNATKADVKQQILVRTRLYMMGRFRGLRACQVPHQDDSKYNVSIICIAKCDGGWYPFLYHDGSHVLAFEHEQEKYPKLYSRQETLLMEAEKGDCIIFFTPLIHRGGPSSMSDADSIPEDTLTDLVFAFHCYHFGLPSGSETGRGKIQFSHLTIENERDEHTFSPDLFSEQFSMMRQRARHGFMMKIRGKRMTSRNANGFDGNIAL